MAVENRIFLPDTDNTLYLSPCKNNYTFDLNSGRYRGSKIQKRPLYLHFLADTSLVKFVYTQIGFLTAYACRLNLTACDTNSDVCQLDDYAKDGGTGEVCPSCSFYHDPLRH